MTKLLISVKNQDEALLALAGGADFIDLKDPTVGALGALDLSTTQKILQVLDGRAIVSATVGEAHQSLDALMDALAQRAAMGVDVIKISAVDIFYQHEFAAEMYKKAAQKAKLVAVFFADALVSLDCLPKLSQAGFYGAMLDTQHKQNGLLKTWPLSQLQQFVLQCRTCALEVGLAGSLQPQDIEILKELHATYLGFRGGVCENAVRNNPISPVRLQMAKNMLRQHNKSGCNPQPDKVLNCIPQGNSV